jgi:hypothetical protein
MIIFREEWGVEGIDFLIPFLMGWISDWMYKTLNTY